MTDAPTDVPKTTLAGKTRQMMALKPAELEDKGLPPKRAQEKYESTTAGWLAVLLGLLLMAGAGYIALVLVQGTRDISVTTVAFIATPASIGLVVFGVGMSLVSRDASPAIGAAGEIVVKIIRAVRGGSAAT
jgi:hypothetical protein